GACADWRRADGDADWAGAADRGPCTAGTGAEAVDGTWAGAPASNTVPLVNVTSRQFPTSRRLDPINPSDSRLASSSPTSRPGRGEVPPRCRVESSWPPD